MAEDTSIEISRAARDRLSLLAAEQGTTVRDLVERLAASMPTNDELAQREVRARASLRETRGPDLTPEMEAAAVRLRTRLAGREDSA